MIATRGYHVEAVRALIGAGADVDIRDDRLDNPFLYAGAEGLLDILRLTIEAGADPTLTNRFGGTALIPASERGHVEVVQELLTRTEVDVDHVNNLGWTALLEAIVLSNGDERHQQVVQLLVDHGADIMIPDKDGVTPLEHARSRGFTEIERILEGRGRRLNAAAGPQSGRRPTMVKTLAGSRSSNVKSVPHSRSMKPAVSYSARAWSRE